MPGFDDVEMEEEEIDEVEEEPEPGIEEDLP